MANVWYERDYGGILPPKLYANWKYDSWQFSSSAQSTKLKKKKKDFFFSKSSRRTIPLRKVVCNVQEIDLKLKYLFE